MIRALVGQIARYVPVSFSAFYSAYSAGVHAILIGKTPVCSVRVEYTHYLFVG